MANSNITKKALAGALLKLMESTSFEKISVAQICDECGMNRKSFYYHFKDKYDLVNWIFDENFISLVKGQPYDSWGFLEALSNYLYENRDFYRRVLRIEGQNSFSEHFQEFMTPLMENRLKAIIGQKSVHPVCIAFLTEGFIGSVKKWLLDKDCLPPETFVSMLKDMVENSLQGLSAELVEVKVGDE